MTYFKTLFLLAVIADSLFYWVGHTTTAFTIGVAVAYILFED